MNDTDLWDMSDNDLEAAFKEAQAIMNSPDTDLEESFSSSDSNDTEDLDNGTEQPEDILEDSDQDEDTSETKENEETVPEESLDEDSEEDQEPSSDDTEDTAEELPAQMYKFRANGKDYEFSSKEIVEQFPKIFGQAMDYTKKMQAIKPWRKTIDAIEEAKLNHNDISLMIDVLKGDKEAITELLKRTGTDTLDLDLEGDSKYVAKDYGRDDTTLAIKDVVDTISQDVEYTTTYNILAKEWDDKSWAVMAQNPEMIKLLHADVKSGMYKTLQPIAEKFKVYDGAKSSDLDYYKAAAQQYFGQIAKQDVYNKQQTELQADKEIKEAEQVRIAEAKAKSQKRVATQQASVKRKAAAPTKAIASNKGVIDYLDDSDEAFDDWYKRLQDNT